MSSGITIMGQKKLERHIRRMSNAPVLFDTDVKKTALNGIRELKVKTPKATGDTAADWSGPKKVSVSQYRVENNKRTPDKKHFIVNILDQGRGVVRPKRSKRLYIPLTEKGKAKRLGANIPKGLVFGIDYVLAKSSKAVSGKKFLDKSFNDSSKELSRRIIKTIRRT